MSPPPALQPLPPLPPIGHVAVMRASRRDFVGTFVEGPSDASMWRRWLRWEPVALGGKAGVLSAMASLAQAHVPGCVGIVDADFDRLDGTLPSSSDVVVSESHDLECDLARSRALDALLAEVADEASLRQLRGAAATFRDALAERALPFGLVRWTFFARGVPYPASRLRPFDLLALAFREPLGKPKAFSNVEAVAVALRLALDSADREALAIWRDLGAWEARSAPFLVRR